MNANFVELVVLGCAAVAVEPRVLLERGMEDADRAIRDRLPSARVEYLAGADATAGARADSAWMRPTSGARFTTIVLSRRRSALDLYGLLSACAPLVEPPYGLVLLVPGLEASDDPAADGLVGREAIEAFRATYGPTWLERRLEHNVIELQRSR